MSNVTSHPVLMTNQSAELVNGSSSDEGISSCTSEQIAVSLVEFGCNTADEQVALLALAWILLIYRGTASGNNGHFTWGFSNLASDEKSDSWEDAGQVSDIIADSTARLSSLLETIQQRRRNNASTFPVYFSNFDPSKPRPEVRCLLAKSD